MTDQNTDKTTLQFVTAFLKSQKGKYEYTQKHLDKVLGSPDHQNNELVWFFKACMFQKMGKIEQSHDCLKMALMSFDYPPNITPPTTEFISSNSIQYCAPKLDYIV
jgi:Tfp pilus assembly protein PilF